HQQDLEPQAGCGDGRDLVFAEFDTLLGRESLPQMGAVERGTVLEYIAFVSLERSVPVDIHVRVVGLVRGRLQQPLRGLLPCVLLRARTVVSLRRRRSRARPLAESRCHRYHLRAQHPEPTLLLAVTVTSGSLHSMVRRVKNTTKQPSTEGNNSSSGAHTGDARKDRWRNHRLARRAEFVEAAIRVLDEHGMELGMDDVA